MSDNEILALFLEKISAAPREHMLSFFADNAARGTILPFTKSLLKVVASVESASPGYAEKTFSRIGAIRYVGERQYESILSILAEIYVIGGMVEQADREEGKLQFAHEPRRKGKKNPECEVRISGQWCAIEVKAPNLFAHSRQRSSKPLQHAVRYSDDAKPTGDCTLPRDNPVKDFLTAADQKFAAYETYRADALHFLIIVWDDFCNEPIAALTGPNSGLLTDDSFNRTEDGRPVRYPHVDGVIICRYLHQFKLATENKPLIDDAGEPLVYRCEGFPPKAFIEVPGGRNVAIELLDALNATPVDACLGAEYHPLETIMWVGAQA